MQKVRVIIEDGTSPCIAVSECSALDMGFEKLNPLQSRFVSEGLHKKDVNVLSVWPTSAGKTVVAELVAEQQLRKGQKVIYACPLKSLAEEKIRRFQKLFPNKRLEIFTGDYSDIEKRPEKAKNADIAICTTELLDSVSRKKDLSQVLIGQAGAIIIDEAHIIATERGPAVESALVKISEFNPEARIILLSATVGNPEEVADWLSFLNGKETVVLKSAWRPVKIGWHLVSDSQKKRKTNDFLWKKMALSGAVKLIKKLTVQDSSSQILVFVWTKSEGRELERLLSKEGIRCLFHNADLELDMRLDFEDRFESGQIRVLIATTTLAWGRNTCARHVVIIGNKRGSSKVPVWDILQAGGRAGRTGLSNKGDVWWFVPDTHEAAHIVKSLPAIKSQMNTPDKLAFALIGQFPLYEKASEDELKSWFLRTFAARTLSSISERSRLFEEAISYLKTVGAVSADMRLTAVGRTARLFYMSPLEVKKIADCLDRMLGAWSKEELLDLLASEPAFTIAVLFAKVQAERNRYVNTDEWQKVQRKFNQPQCHVRLSPLIVRGLISSSRRNAFFTAVVQAVSWLDEMKDYLQRKSENPRVSLRPPLPDLSIRGLIFDLSRLATAVSYYCSQIGCGEIGQAVAEMASIIRYGAPVQLKELLKVKGIGVIRAYELYRAGMRTPEDILKAHSDIFMKEKIEKILPSSVLENVKKFCKGEKHD